MRKKEIIIAGMVGVFLFIALFLWLRFKGEARVMSSDLSIPTLDKEIALDVLPEVKVLSGTVKIISGNEVVLKVFPIDGKDMEDVRMIDAEGVPIFKNVELSPEELQKKIEEQASQSSIDPMNLPGQSEMDVFSKKNPATIAEMRPGDVITVVSDIDIRDMKEIKPKEISFVLGSQISYPEGYQP